MPEQREPVGAAPIIAQDPEGLARVLDDVHDRGHPMEVPAYDADGHAVLVVATDVGDEARAYDYVGLEGRGPANELAFPVVMLVRAIALGMVSTGADEGSEDA